VDRIVRDAVLDLIGDGNSLTSLSLIGIARYTGVSRNAIYRRWKTKEDLYVEVLTTIDHEVPALSAQSARENLVSLMDAEVHRAADPRVRRLELAVRAEAGSFPDLYRYFMSQYVAPLLDALRSMIRRGKETGEIRVDVSEDVLADLLMSSVISTISFVGVSSEDTSGLSQRRIDLAFEGAAPK
jgi:AcrR family transcriptional regulator